MRVEVEIVVVVEVVEIVVEVEVVEIVVEVEVVEMVVEQTYFPWEFQNSENWD